eukprot:19161-Rhodomonas_salina.1
MNQRAARTPEESGSDLAPREHQLQGPLLQREAQSIEPKQHPVLDPRWTWDGLCRGCGLPSAWQLCLSATSTLFPAPITLTLLVR